MVLAALPPKPYHVLLCAVQPRQLPPHKAIGSRPGDCVCSLTRIGGNSIIVWDICVVLCRFIMPGDTDSPYLSLAEASRMLGVHCATLRRWADAGSVPVYTTPGGHRRFARADIETLTARRTPSAPDLSSTWANRALAQTRSDLSVAHREQRSAWMEHLPAEERGRWRRIGQQLMGVVLRYINSTGAEQPLLEEARAIGMSYATEAHRAGMPLTAALEAALFFRDSLIESAMDLPADANLRPQENARLLRRISRVANVVQLAVAQSYDQTHKESKE
jgi:excisionase family DNA binding protein